MNDDATEGLMFRFDGQEADEHKLELYSLGESMQGLARIASVSAHFAATQKYSRYFVTHSFRIYAEEPRANCFTISAVWEFVKQHQILSGAFGALAAILVNWVLTSNASKVEEMKLLKDSLDKVIRELGNRDQATIAGLISTVEKMAAELRNAARLAVSPIGSTANLLTVSARNGDFRQSYNLADAEAIRQPGPNELTGLETVVVRLSELDSLRGTCKVHLRGLPEDHRIAAEILDPVREVPNNAYALALASGNEIAVKAKLQLKNDEIVRLYISDVEA